MSIDAERIMKRKGGTEHRTVQASAVILLEDGVVLDCEGVGFEGWRFCRPQEQLGLWHLALS